MARVAIALGSNLGDRTAHLGWAVEQLSRFIDDTRVSPVIETAPVDVPDVQPPYLNAVLVGDTGLSPEALIERLGEIEAARGRRRTTFREARTLDLDVILLGNQVIDTPRLVVPHPRFRERPFVLGPLAVLEPHWVDPVTGKTVKELLLALE